VQGSPLVSVVTPFYNTAEYLEECIRSVLAQDCADFEYLLCDNASDDGSSEIARRYAAQDSRIRYLRFEDHVPQVRNYNRALTFIHPHSRYCKVVQADDLLEAECLSAMVSVAHAHPTAGLVVGFYRQGDVIRTDGWPELRQLWHGREVARGKLLHDHFPTGSPTSVMYRADLVRRRLPDFYAPDRYSEDTDVEFDILAESELAFVPRVLSFLRTDDRSISGSVRRFSPWYVFRVVTVQRHGPRFLEEPALAQLRHRVETDYLNFLGRSLLKLEPPAFWAYHAGALSTVGRRLPRAAIAAAAFRELARHLSSPAESLRKIIRGGRSRPRESERGQ
jgi:glycosyltransferase involved in cell wall biosynthesis